MFKRVKYRIYPTDKQKVLLGKHFGCARWIYNWGLQQKSEQYRLTGKSPSVYTLQKQVTVKKTEPETEWLAEVSAASLQNALLNLDSAFTRFFKHISAYPRFKSKHDRHQSFQHPQGTRIDWERSRIKIVGFREGIKATLSRRIDGEIKTCSVMLTPTGKYYISILVDTGAPEPIPPPAEEATALGLDFGLKDLVITSDGQHFANPRALKTHLRRLKIRSRRLSRKVKGSKNRDKARLRVALVHERISDIRRNALHQISSELVRKNHATTLCIEDLAIDEMVSKGKHRSSRSLRRSISDVGWGTLRRMLEYKVKWAGKNLIIIGQFEPSSKMCSVCGHINQGLTLAEREWTCQCSAHHDRDINAAINIRQMAFRKQNTSSAPEVQPSKPVCRRGRKAKATEYREVTRESTPVEQPHVVATKQECQCDSHDE